MSTRWVPPISDGEIIRQIRKLLKKYSSATGQVNVTGLSLDINAAIGDAGKILADTNGYAIGYFNLSYGQFSFGYNLNHETSTYLAKIEDRQNGNSAQQSDQLNFLLDAYKFFVVPPQSNPNLEGEDSIASKYLRIESALGGAVDRFEELQVSFTKKNEDLRERHESAVEVLRNQIAEEKAALEAEVQLKHQEIDKVRKELDDRSNTHARRQIRNEIKTSITESLSKPTFTAQTHEGRKFVRGAYIASIVVFIVFAGFNLYTFNQVVSGTSDLAIWWSGIKATISTLTAIGLILLFLKWEVNWLNQQASFERLLSSTKVDIDRASWVAESYLEWNRESSGREIPSELLASFTRRLFDWDGKVEDGHSTTDSLASAILGSASKLSIGPNGANVELNQRGIKNLNREQ